MMVASSLRHLCMLLPLIIASIAGTASSASAQYYVYRGVSANPDGSVDWSKASFGVSGNPVPTLSFFHYESDADARNGLPAAQCIVKVFLPDVQTPPTPGAFSSIGARTDRRKDVALYLPDTINNTPTVGLIGPFPWQILFDDNPPGHWSIEKPQIVITTTPPQSNNTASTIAGGGFKALANTGGAGVTVINGSLDNCHY